MNYQGPGHYVHYKGGQYEVEGLALWEPMADKPDNEPGISDAVAAIAENLPDGPSKQVLMRAAELLSETQFVIYRPLTPGSLLEEREEEFWARGRKDFDMKVITDVTMLSVGLTAHGPESRMIGDAKPRFQKTA